MASQKEVTIYAPKAFKFNTGDVKQGNAGIIDIPAGTSRVSAEIAAHKWVKAHTAEAPGQEMLGGQSETQLGADLTEALRRAGVAEAALEAARAENKALADELDAMRQAMAQTPDERVAELEKKLAGAVAEGDQVRAELAKLKSGKAK